MAAYSTMLTSNHTAVLKRQRFNTNVLSISQLHHLHIFTCISHTSNNKRMLPLVSQLSCTGKQSYHVRSRQRRSDYKPIISHSQRNIQTIITLNIRQGYSLYKWHDRNPVSFISLSMFVDFLLVYQTYWWCSMADDNRKGSRKRERDPWHPQRVTYFRRFVIWCTLW